MQYFKGPYFASKGDFASAGAADIRSADSLPKNLVGLTAGSFLYGRALFAGSPDAFGGKLLYGLELFHEDGPWVRADDYRRLNGVLRYSHGAGEARWAITAMGYSGRWNATDQVPLRAVDSGEIDRFGAIDTTSGGRTHRFSLSADYRHDLGDALLQADLYAVKYRLDLFSNFTYFLVDPVNGDQFEQSDDRWQLGTSGHVSWTAKESAIGLRVTGGWEARHDRIDPVGLYDTAARIRLRTVRQDLVRETSGGLFLESEAALTRWLRAVAGARYDHYWFDVISGEPANSGRESAGRLSPKLSAILGPFAQTEVFANLGLGFHSNDARGVTATVDPASGAPVSKTPPLVETRGGELGVRTGLVPGVQSSLALWRLDLDSELLFTGDAGTTEPSRPSRRQGVEWSTRWQPIRWLLFDLDVSWSRARFTSVDPVSGGDHIPGSIEIGDLRRRHPAKSGAVDRERVPALLRPEAAHRGRPRALDRFDALQRAGELPGRGVGEGLAGDLQPARRAGRRHRLLLCFTAAQRPRMQRAAGRRESDLRCRRRPFPSGGKAQLPADDRLHVLKREGTASALRSVPAERGRGEAFVSEARSRG